MQRFVLTSRFTPQRRLVALAMATPAAAAAARRVVGQPSTPALLTSARAKSCPASQYGDEAKTTAAPTPKVTHYSKLGMDGFTDVRFNTAADEFLERVESVIDALEHPEVEDIGCTGGVLTLETAHKGTYIINKQAPNVQLWLSSPISGPHHYDMVVTEEAGDGKGGTVAWLSDHDAHSLKEKLEQELSEILGTPVEL